ncbi:uncharacterized protein LOC110441401 [Mizuhopecten yessoensis]|uniref:uncharacterized protein LOC110441401 n=1 Tax=Mizuhopecten yessoensis TaxID=6573 RepID=UPI000B45B538|nr:uncharacterized protein LOC110441401 [Mizuhopecten yessoensis]
MSAGTMSAPTEDQVAHAQRVREETHFFRDCLLEGQLLKGVPLAFGIFTFLEYRKKIGRSSRHWAINGFVGGLVGILLARISNVSECRRKTLEQFPDGDLAKLMQYRPKTDRNQVPGYESSQPLSRVQRDDESSFPDHDGKCIGP